MKKQIIVTLGPSSFDEKIVKRMARSGADYFRINLSHTEAKDYKKIINQVSAWTNKPVCPDTEGAQLRTGKIDNKKKFIELIKKQLEFMLEPIVQQLCSHRLHDLSQMLCARI